jgi:hypothetical protein
MSVDFYKVHGTTCQKIVLFAVEFLRNATCNVATVSLLSEQEKIQYGTRGTTDGNKIWNEGPDNPVVLFHVTYRSFHFP